MNDPPGESTNRTTDPSPVDENNRPPPPHPSAARLGVVVLFIGTWMALGWWLRLDANQYLLLGVPLTIAFQLFIQRQPLRALWVRDAPPLRVTAAWISTTAALAALPAYGLYRAGFQHGWVFVAWYVCAILGAPAAAYAIQNCNRRVKRGATPSVLMVILISLLMLAVALSRSGLGVFRWHALWQFVQWSLLYFTVSFFLEEVTFRGALDAYLYRPSDTRGAGTAAALAFLWGVWHLPFVPIERALPIVAIQIGLWHMMVGVPLAMSWRIGGSLLVPAAAHAVLDGVRNAVQLHPQ